MQNQDFRERIEYTALYIDFTLTVIQMLCVIVMVLFSIILGLIYWFDYTLTIMLLCVVEIFTSIFGVVSIAQSLYMEKSKIQDIKYKYKLEYYKEIKDETI